MNELVPDVEKFTFMGFTFDKYLTFNFYLLFYVQKITFCQKTYVEKLSLYCYIFLQFFFFVWHINGKAVTKDQHPYRYAF